MAWTKFTASALAMGLFLNACANGPGNEAASDDTQERTAPLRQRTGPFVLHVDSEAGLQSHPDAEEAAMPVDNRFGATGKGAAGGFLVGGAIGVALISGGCDRSWKDFIYVVCPVSVVLGVGTTVAGAVIGGLGGLVFDFADATGETPAGETVDAVAGRSVASFLAPTPAPALRTRLAEAMAAKAPGRLVALPQAGFGAEQASANAQGPLVLLVRINDLRFVRTKGDSPELWLRVRLSAALYDDPNSGQHELRGWRFTTRLGDFEKLAETNAVDLEPKIGEAMAEVVAAVVEDLFREDGEVREVSNFYVAEKVMGNSGSDPLWSGALFLTPGTKAECGDVAAQRAVGWRFAALDPRVYGSIAREKWVEAYKWLRLAENEGMDDAALQEALTALREKLPSEKIEAAEQEIAGWTPKPCDEAVEKEKEKEGSGAGKDEPADGPAEVSPSPIPPNERPERS